MPGTIQVSVSLTPVAVEGEGARANGVSLKIAMGKREYQTMEDGDFSFPLVSLRENLQLMLYNKEGNSIWHREFKTALVAEKGILDDEFSVEGGGVLQVRMKFLLSEEDRMRIRKMRNSALKRKHGDLVKGGYDDHASDGDSNLRSYAVLQTMKDFNEGLLTNDVSEKNERIGKAKRESSTEGLRETVVSFNGSMQKERLELMLTSSGEAIKENASFSAESQDHIHAPQKEKFLVSSSSSNVMKMISAFESSASQGHNVGPTTSFLSNNKVVGSLRRTSSEEEYLKTIMQQQITKSFSSGTLSDANVQGNSKNPRLVIIKMQESNEHSDNVNCEEATKDENQLSNSEVHKNVYDPEAANQKASELKIVSKSSSQVQKLTMTGEPISQNRSADHVNQMENDNSHKAGSDPTISSDPTFISRHECSGELAKLDVLQKGYFAVSENSMETAADSCNSEAQIAFSTNKEPFKVKSRSNSAGNEPRRINDIPSGDRSTDDTPAAVAFSTSQDISSIGSEIPSASITGWLPIDMAKEKLHETDYFDMTTGQNANAVFEQNVLDEASLLETVSNESVTRDDTCGLWIPQHENITSAVSNGFFCRNCMDDLKDQLPFGVSHESMDIFFKREKFLFSAFATWVPHHVCVTMGSGKLRNLLEHCDMCLGPLSVDETFSVLAGEKQKIIGSSSVEVMTSKKVSKKIENLNKDDSLGSRNLNERLIDQGARIIIIIVACGTILLSTR